MFFPSFDSFNLLSSALLALGIQVVFFFFAALFKTDKVTDLSYSLSFILLAVLLLTGRKNIFPLQLLLAAMIVLWGLRLGGYLLVRILHMKRDARFDGIRENLFKFAAFWFFQAVTVWVVMLPSILFLSLSRAPRLNAAVIIGALIWLAGLIIESAADAQKYRFRVNEANKGRWIEHGLWRWSRHPNFFGEILCWTGLFVLIAPSLEGWMWVGLAGPLFITVILLFFSGIPTVEKRSEASYGSNPDYRRYKESTSLLVPRPPRKLVD
jgi:steroid 5-alpha reductase family enzyme